jgi:ATP-binding cassette subfamily F protein 3
MIQIAGLTLARGSKTILHQTDLTLFPKEKVGLVGHNGAGKSSFIAALLGELSIDQGSIDLPKSWRLAWIDQEVGNLDTPVIDFALEGDQALHAIRTQIQQAEQTGDHTHTAHLYEQLENLDGYTAESRVATILHGLGFKPSDLKRKVKEFSGGWKMRLNLAKVLGSRADLILLDEPTNHLDIEAVIWLQQWIQQVDSTVIVISHDRDFLDEVCTHTVHLHQEKLNKYTGNYSTFERTFAERAEQVNQANRKASAEIEKLQRFVDRFKAKATKAKQAQSRVKRLEKIKVIETLQVDNHVSIPFLEPHKSPDPLVVLQKVSCGYAANQAVLDNIRIEIRPGDRIGLLGANGNGKTTLVKTIVGQLKPLGGERVEGKGLVYGYFAQDQIESLDLQATPLEHLSRLDKQATEQQLRDFLARFQFREDKVKQVVNGFSGGEKSRLALALLAYQRPNLLLLDEPTNHLDMATRQALANALLEFSGALVMVSHDRHLLESIVDTYWRVHQGQLSPFDGDLDDYAEQLKRETTSANTAQASQASASTGKPEVQINKQDRQAKHQRLKTLKNNLKKLEKNLQDLQQRLEQQDSKLAQFDYSNATSAQQANQLQEERNQTSSNVETLETELLEIMLNIEELETELGV